MGFHDRLTGAAVTLIRPKLLIETARIGARLYRRERDLAAALPGHAWASREQIVARLGAAERDCEEMRRARAPAYRPAAHVQVLAALLAEAGALAAQAKASGSASLRRAM